MKPCPLRKTCEWCGKQYGRKTRITSSGRIEYEDKYKFLHRSKYCSRECSCKADGERRRLAAEQRRQEEAALEKKFNRAFQAFVY